MSAPSTQDWLALARLDLYLAGQPRVVYTFPRQKDVRGIQTYADTDSVGRLRARKSTSGWPAMGC